MPASEHEKFTGTISSVGDVGPFTRSWCRFCGAPWPCKDAEIEQLTADLAAAQSLADARQAEVLRLQQIMTIDIDGAKACLTGEPITSNPHPEPGEFWHLWRQGWNRIEHKRLASARGVTIAQLRQSLVNTAIACPRDGEPCWCDRPLLDTHDAECMEIRALLASPGPDDEAGAALLRAADRLIDEGLPIYEMNGGYRDCPWCGPVTALDKHSADCPWPPFVHAMRRARALGAGSGSMTTAGGDLFAKEDS